MRLSLSYSGILRSTCHTRISLPGARRSLAVQSQFVWAGSSSKSLKGQLFRLRFFFIQSKTWYAWVFLPSQKILKLHLARFLDKYFQFWVALVAMALYSQADPSTSASDPGVPSSSLNCCVGVNSKAVWSFPVWILPTSQTIKLPNKKICLARRVVSPYQPFCSAEYDQSSGFFARFVSSLLPNIYRRTVRYLVRPKFTSCKSNSIALRCYRAKWPR